MQTTTENKIASALEAAIEKTACEIGKWYVYTGDDYVQLIWTCDKERLPEMYGDEPWTQWGGDEIINAAGVRNLDDSGIDSYLDKFGEDLVSHWAQWNVEEDL